MSHQLKYPFFLVVIIFITCLIFSAVGFYTTDIILSNIWQPDLVFQFGVLTAFSSLMAIIAMIATSFRSASSFRLIFLIFLIATLFLFGPVPLFALMSFLAASLVSGTIATSYKSDVSLDITTRTLTGMAIITIGLNWISPLPVNTTSSHALVMAGLLIFALYNTRTRETIQNDFDAMAKITKCYEHRTASGAGAVLATIWLTIVFAWLLALAALPERYADALAMHLYIPSYVSSHWRWDYDAMNHAYAFMPAAADYIYTYFFLLGGESAAKLYNFAALSMVSILAYKMCRKESDALSSLLSVALFVSTPIVFIETTSLFVENTLALWIVGCMYVVTRHRHSLANADTPILALLASLCSTKLHGALTAAIIGMLVVTILLYSASSRQTITFIVKGVCFAILGSFPYLNAMVFTGNPFFPYYNDIFKSTAFEPIRFVDERWTNKLDWTFLYSSVFDSPNFMESWPGAAGLTWLLFLPAAIALALIRRRSTSLLCAVVALTSASVVLSQIQYLRYVFPVLPLLAVPISVLIERFSHGIGRFLLAPVIVCVALFNGYKMPSAGWILGDTNLRALYDGEARRQLELSQTAERVFNRIVNDIEGPDARVLYTVSPSGALLQGTAIYSNWASGHYRRQGSHIKTIEDAEDYLSELRISNVVHRGGGDNVIADLIVAAAKRSGRLIVSANSVELYSMKP